MKYFILTTFAVMLAFSVYAYDAQTTSYGGGNAVGNANKICEQNLNEMFVKIGIKSQNIRNDLENAYKGGGYDPCEYAVFIEGFAR